MSFNMRLYSDYVRSIGNINIDTSNKCTLQCVFCMRQTKNGKKKIKRSGTMSFHDWKLCIQLTKTVTMCGQISDPIYHPNFISFLRYAGQNNTHVCIHTNGSGKKKKFWEECFSLKGQFRWVFGIDGLDQKTVNLHRIGQNFHQSYKAMLMGSKASRNHYIIWQFIPFLHNEEQLPRAIDTAHRHNIDFVILKSHRHNSNQNIIVNNKPIKRDWIHPPRSQNLYSLNEHAHKEYV